MPSLINSHEGNVYYNYSSVPLLQGLSGPSEVNTSLISYLDAWQAAGLGSYFRSGEYVYLIFNSALETITSLASSSLYRVQWTANGRWPGYYDGFNTSNGNTAQVIWNLSGTGTCITGSANDKVYRIINNHAIAQAVFDPNMVLKGFFYSGWLREPAFIGSEAPKGLVYLNTHVGRYLRPTAVNVNNTSFLGWLSSANNSITTPPIACSDGSTDADATDIVIRDSTDPYKPIGKLHNCISLPNSTVIGQIWKNIGVDPETGLPHTSSNTDKYLVVCQWGSRKLGMRIWTEGYSE